MHNRRKRKNS